MAKQRVRNLIKKVLLAEDCPKSSEVSLLFTDDEYIQVLNHDYRNIDKPTDVLAFSLLEGEEFAEDEEEYPLGDIVISVETAKRQAEERGASLDEEIDMLAVHGVLHLLGYDHATSEDEKTMFARQQELLDSCLEQ